MTVDSCRFCGTNLSKEECLCAETIQEIDIIYEIVRTEVTVVIKECPACEKVNKGSFPQGVNGEIQYGIGIRAVRDICCSKTKQKVAGCFRTLKYAQCYTRIMS